MEFRLLGPLDVRVDGHAVPLGGPKQRALLALLLLQANRVVSTDRLMDELWGDGSPTVKSLHVYVSRLRKTLGDDRLLTQQPGYLLRAGEEEVDAARFERLLAESEGAAPEVAAARLREALALWRGSPLADLSGEPFAAAEIARLEELRLVAVEERIAADAALGRHADLVGELEALVREHPLREQLRSRLMLCLYRCGRQAEALSAFLEARAALTEELGIEPGRELRDLHEAILRQDPALDLAQPAPTVTSATFVGRRQERTRLIAALDAAIAGQGRVALLAGEPGIGKSRLAEELADVAHARGAQVLVGRCWEAGGAPAFWPWVQSLRSYVRGCDDGALRDAIGDGGAALAQMLPELRARLPDLPQHPSLELEGTRFLLFEAVSDLVSRAAQGAPLVLILDDLHAADEPSLLLLRYVARQIAGSRVLVLGAYRDVDPTPRGPLVDMLAALAREPNAERIPLSGLQEEDVAAYLDLHAGGQASPQDAGAIHAETEGNPLFIVELVRFLHAGGRLDAIPPDVRPVIGRRVRGLPAGCVEVLEAASVLGREFDVGVLAGMTGARNEAVLELLDPGLAERVVDDTPGAPGSLRFSHALVRDVLYDELTAARRAMLHAQAAAVLEREPTSDRLPELARHFLAAIPAGTTPQAIRYARMAGDRAAAQLAYEEAARLYARALSLCTDGAARVELLLAIGDVRARAGDQAASKEAFRDAAQLADANGLPEQLAHAALGYGGRIIWDVSRDDPLLARLLERALEAQCDRESALRVRLQARLAGGPLRDAAVPPQRRRALSSEALAVARRLGDDATLAYALHGYILGHHSPEHTSSQLELARELVDVARRAGDSERVVEGLEEHLDAALELGDATTAERDLQEMAQAAAELRQPSQEWLVAVYRAMFALMRSPQEAGPLIERARVLGERTQSWNATVTHRMQLYALCREEDRLRDVREPVRAALDEFPTYPVWRCVLAHVSAELGDADDARAMLATDLPRDEEWLPGTCLLAEAAVLLGESDRAAELYAQLLPYDERVGVAVPEICIGAVARHLALLAATLGDTAAAERHFATALRVHERLDARPWLERTMRERARLL